MASKYKAKAKKGKNVDELSEEQYDSETDCLVNVEAEHTCNQERSNDFNQSNGHGSGDLSGKLNGDSDAADKMQTLITMFSDMTKAIVQLTDGVNETIRTRNGEKATGIREKPVKRTQNKYSGGNRSINSQVVSEDTSSGSESDSDSDSSERLSDVGRSASSENAVVRVLSSGKFNVKIPPFKGNNGGESWKVWLSRFQEITARQNLSDNERLDSLLPRLQGDAANFVFGQLTPGLRSNYKMLVTELTNRFRVVETTRTYQAQFSRRSQQFGESVENFAADLKRIYDKAYPNRDRKTRNEDLLRKFLDGVENKVASFQVEYVKEPLDVDEAVDCIINFTQTRGQSENRVDPYARALKHEDEMERIARAKPGTFSQKISHSSTGCEASSESGERETVDSEKCKSGSSEIGELKTMLQECLAKFANENRGQAVVNNDSQKKGYYSGRKEIVCFNCGGKGHYARECYRNQSAGGNRGGYQKKVPHQYQRTERTERVQKDPLN